jgi:hypothetical protein
MEVRINAVGQIVSSELENDPNLGKFILIEPLPGVNSLKGTTSFIIVKSPVPEMENCFDDWVEDKETLEVYLSDWDIRWL